MESSLRAFMSGLIDYAGLFPPAKLSLDESIRNFAKYRSEEDAWMLSRFIIPAGKLNELRAYGELLNTSTPFDFSVISQAADTLQSFREAVATSAEQILSLHDQLEPNVLTGALEVKLPIEAIIEGKETSSQALQTLVDQMAEHQALPKQVYCEPKFTENWRSEIPAVMAAISEVNDRTDQVALAFKLRCGGVEAHLFPTVEQVAAVLYQAREKNVAMKCTAGLHHPIRHYSDSVGTKMHGFFNVFGAGLLGYAHDLAEEEVAHIIRDEDPSQFKFTGSMFSWADMDISEDEIAELRKTALHSYGSCSFDEPREDLDELHLR
ncbi:MAG: hypothetical protein ACQETE_06175 [Bacteroidota bacterium]